MPAYYKLTGKTPRFTNYSIKTLNSNSWISNKKAKEELGYDPRPIKKSIEDTIKWFKDAEIIT
jgi:dihydroflavonol-4-reductase